MFYVITSLITLIKCTVALRHLDVDYILPTLDRISMIYIQ